MPELTVGFIGLGNIGRPCARHLVAAGYQTYVHDLNPAAVNNLVTHGAIDGESTARVAAQCDVTFLSLPGPHEVANVLSESDGLIANALPGAIIVDLSTNSLAVAQHWAAACADADLHYLDSPVSGGAWGAEAGELTLMPSGNKTAYPRARPAMVTFGRQDTEYLGPTGTGTLLKLVNNQIFLAGGQLVQEAYLLASKAGVAPETFFKVLSNGSAGMYMPLASIVLARQWEDSSYDLALAEKDMYLALDTARDLDVPLPITQAAHQTLLAAKAAGLGQKFFLATMEALEQAAHHTAERFDPS